MGETRDKQNRVDDLGDSSSPERVIIGLDGESYKVRGTDNSQGAGVNGATGSSTGTEERRSEPEFTRPSSLGMFGWDEDKQQEKTTRRNPASAKYTPKASPGITPKTCGNIAGGIADTISFILTRTPVLGLNEEEEKQMGESLFETVSNFPATSASVKLLNYLAPWAGLIHTGSKIVWKRMAFIAHHKNKQTIKVPPANPAPEDGMFIIPDPARVN